MAKKQTENKKPLNAEADIKDGELQQRFRVQFDVGYRPKKGKEMDPENNTIPDMNLTVRQLMENHTRGIDNNIHAKQPLYFEHQLPNIQDLTDVQKYRDYLESEAEKVKQFIDQDLENARKKRQSTEQQTTPKEEGTTNVSND